MATFLLRRLAGLLPALLGISAVLFTVLALAPGDPFEELAGNPDVPAELRLRLREQFGLDAPVWQRYLHWLGAMLQGEWGYSHVSRVDVDQLILQRLPLTLGVIGSAQLLALAIALPLGVLVALRPHSLLDRGVTTLAMLGFSLPTFFTGTLAILVFSIQLGWLPFIFQADVAASGAAWWGLQLRQSLMPVTVLGLYLAASWLRHVRSAVLEVLRLPHVTTARAKGLPLRQVIVRHVLRNAAIPVVTVVTLQMPMVFGGAIVTEQIFRVPGLGSLLIEAIQRNDTPVVMAVTFLFAAAVLVFNLLADLLYGWLDPRIVQR